MLRCLSLDLTGALRACCWLKHLSRKSLPQGQKAFRQVRRSLSLTSLALGLASADVGLASGFAGLSWRRASLARLALGLGWAALPLAWPALALARGRPGRGSRRACRPWPAVRQARGRRAFASPTLPLASPTAVQTRAVPTQGWEARRLAWAGLPLASEAPIQHCYADNFWARVKNVTAIP